MTKITKTYKIPQGFTLGKCKKCRNPYAYAGLDIGLCVRCLDESIEKEDKNERRIKKNQRRKKET